MLRAGIILKSGGTLELFDDNIVANSVIITMSVCGKNKYDIGTFNAASLKISIIDDDALQHEFSGAAVGLTETTGEGQEAETTYLGTYYIDGTTVKRNRKTVSFTAYDRSLKFDVELPDSARETSYTALTAIQAACTATGTTLFTAELTDFANTSVSFTLENAALQTWRDVVMWCCQLIAGYAIIDRYGRLKIIHARWQADDTINHVITAAQRVSIQFSDTRLYPKCMTAYAGNVVKNYKSGYVPSGDQAIQAQEGKCNLKSNPLVASMSEIDGDSINAAILGNIQSFEQRQITAKLFQNSLIGLGDAIRFSGGKIDVRRSVLGMATHIEWRYHGYTIVTCTAPDPAEENDSNE